MLINRSWMPLILREAEGLGGAAPADELAPEAAADTPASPESVLFPNEGEEPKPDADPADPDKAAGDDDAAPEWKEFEPDASKSDEENAAAKAEHDKAKPAADPDAVPADGKYELTMPEGMEVDAELLDTLGPEFQELGLTNAQAQKLSEKYAEIIAKRTADQSAGWGETIGKWATDAKADKEIGGDNWDGTVSASRRAVDTLGTPELKEYLNASGGGNHPELIRFMSKVGAMISEDDPASGSASGSGKPAEAAHSLFPNDVPKG